MSFVNEHEQTFESEFVDVQLPGEGGNGNITVDQAVIENSKNPVSGGAVKKYVDEQISKIEIPEGESVDLTDYYTKEEIDNKGFVTADDLPKINIDDEISDTSENPVKNKVLKAWIDSIVTNVGQDMSKQHNEILEAVEKFILENVVLKQVGKGLSTNDFTDEYKTKVDNSVSQEYLDEQIGYIETALDSIISAQENLIGGAE